MRSAGGLGKAVAYSDERARRLQLELPVLLKSNAGLQQSLGMTVNISRSGVLFRTEQPIEVGHKLSLQIILHSKSSSHLPVTIDCAVTVVRVESDAAHPLVSIVAAQFQEALLAGVPEA